MTLVSAPVSCQRYQRYVGPPLCRVPFATGSRGPREKTVGATRHREFRTRKADLIGSPARYFQTVVKHIEQVRQRVGATPTGCSDASTDSSETKATATSTIVIAPLSPSSSPSLSSSPSSEITGRMKEKKEKEKEKRRKEQRKNCARSRNAKMQMRRAHVHAYAGN